MAINASPVNNSTGFWANLSLRVKALAVISLPVAAVIASAFLFSRIEHAKDDQQLLQRNGYELRTQLLNMYIVMSSAESAMRSFALTGKEDGIQPLRLLGPSIDNYFEKMSTLSIETPEQANRLAQLKQKTRARVEGIKNLHDFYQTHLEDHVPPPAEMMEAARISPELLLGITAFFTAEGKLLQERAAALQTRLTRLHVALIAGLSFVLFGGVAAVILFMTSIVRRIRQLQMNAARLEKASPHDTVPAGRDELGHLAAAMEKAGEILANQDREIRTALENAQVLIWDLNTESQSLRYYAGAGTLGDSILPVELLAPNVEGWISAIHAEDRQRIQQQLACASADGNPLHLEYRVVIRGGEIRWMMVRAERCDSGAGKPQRFLGVLADVTERRKAAIEIERQAHQLADSREALERQTRILKSILDSMGDGVVVVDTEGKVLVYNPAAEQILGTRAFTGEAGTWAERCGLYLPDKTSLYSTDQLPFVRAIHGHPVDAAEVFVRPNSGEESIWVSITARPLRQEDGAIRGGVMVLRDITSAKKNADALELAKHEAETANQAKSEFLSRMSHELRTPLNAILGFGQLLELSDLNKQESDNVQHILKGGYHLLDLINEILDLARIESGRLSLSPEPVRIREVLGDALELVRPLAMDQNIHISPDSAMQCNHHVHADGQRLKQVLLNLLSNAIKFNRKGGSIVVSCREVPGDRLRLEIADSGCGISPDGLRKLFTPFERLSADRTDVGGTGLGLALSKRLIEAMGGTIGVDSAVGLGSRFYIELALLDDPAVWLEENPGILEIARQETALYRGTVLYIEDNASNLRLIERIMAHCTDVRLITAMQGQLGLDLAQMHSPDWILLDLHLPDIPGEEVLNRLRLNPRTHGIPVTVLSADATRGQINRLITAGARDYLTKPVDVRQLLRLLEQTLKHQGTKPASEPLKETEYAERDHSK